MPEYHRFTGPRAKATPAEIEAAARQYVRKVSGITSPSGQTDEAFERAVRKVGEATAELLGDLPPRRQPPATCRHCAGYAP